MYALLEKHPHGRSEIIQAMNKLLEALSGAAIVAACIFLRPLLRPWYSSWGATKAELSNTYPGDEYAPNPKGGYTQAITIQTPSSLSGHGWYRLDRIRAGSIVTNYWRIL